MNDKWINLKWWAFIPLRDFHCRLSWAFKSAQYPRASFEYMQKGEMVKEICSLFWKQNLLECKHTRYYIKWMVTFLMVTITILGCWFGCSFVAGLWPVVSSCVYSPMFREGMLCEYHYSWCTLDGFCKLLFQD